MTQSAAHIVVPTRETTLFERLQALVKASGPNRHDQAINLCTACIAAGIDTIGAIMEPAVRLGLKREHVARILKEGLGQRWRKSADGIFSLID
jgi:hypothetical protein